MDGGDDDVIGPSVAEQLFRTRDPVSTAFGVLVENVAAAERDATPDQAFPVPLPAILTGPAPWNMYITRTMQHGYRAVGFKAHDSPVYQWPDGIEPLYGSESWAYSLPRGEHITIQYNGNNEGHVYIFTTAAPSGDESGDPTGKCTHAITPEAVVALVTNAIQTSDGVGIDYAVSTALSNIDDNLAPTFRGLPRDFCFIAFANLLLNRSVNVNGRTYKIVKQNPYIDFPANAADVGFGEFLSQELRVQLQQSGADTAGSFVDLCAAGVYHAARI